MAKKIQRGMVSWVGDTDPNDPEDDMFANIDVDDDGLLNSEEDGNHNSIFEPELGETDPFNADSDGDSILDGEEVGDTTDPRDSDEDGVIDALDWTAMVIVSPIGLSLVTLNQYCAD